MVEIDKLVQQLNVFGCARIAGAAAAKLPEFTSAFGALFASNCVDGADSRLTERNVFSHVPALLELSQSTLVTRLCDLYFRCPSRVVTSDANLLVGDSYWHSDGYYETPFLRFVIYLERLDARNGALRFIVGSHRFGGDWLGDATRKIVKHHDELGLDGADVPSYIADCEPGDLIVFDTNTMHSSWNGTRRRQLAFNAVGAHISAQGRQDTARYFLNRYTSGSVLLP